MAAKLDKLRNVQVNLQLEQLGTRTKNAVQHAQVELHTVVPIPQSLLVYVYTA